MKLIVAFAVCSLAVAPAQEQTTPAASADLAKAIAEMRNLPEKLVGQEAEERGPRIHAAWQTLIAAKDDGVSALLAEAARLTAAKQKDDRFRLGAAAVVWQIGRFDRVADVVALWADADFAVKYSYAFPIAVEAALDGDERALPLLQALLRDQRGEYFIADHVMQIGWPLTHAFLWGPMGRKAVPALESVLATAKDPTVTSSAIWLVANAWQASALPRLRQIARDAPQPARTAAIDAIGSFGHPEDYDFLCAGLADGDPKIVRAHVEALRAFGDLRVVPKLLPLTKHVDEDVRLHALAALGVLATIEGLECYAERLTALGEESRGWFAQGPHLLLSADVEWQDYLKADRDARGKLLAKAHAQSREKFMPRAGDRKLSREELETACKSWIAESRLPDDEHEWQQAREILAAATIADVPLLLDVRGRLLRRLSDECLAEVEIVDHTLRWVVRSQYRLDPFLCEHVQPVPPAKTDTK